MNRADRRAATRGLHKLGCRCRPDVFDVPRALWPEGARSGAFIQHQTGCPFGTRVAALNAQGVIPALIDRPERCER